MLVAFSPGALALEPLPGRHLPIAAQQAGEPIKYVLAGATGATVRNLPDQKGRDVLRVPGNAPLAVYAELQGNLKVAAPGGLKVWVFGKYLTESARPGWVEVSGSYINMRPRPQTQNSYPLGQLDRGDRLRFIQRQDPTKPMSEDWVQVYSPPDTMGYVLAAETRALPAGANASSLWKDAVSTALGGRSDVSIPSGSQGNKSTNAGNRTIGNGTQATAPKTPSNPGIFSKLAEANSAMDIGLSSANPDYSALFTNYQAVLALGPDAPTRLLIEERVKRLELHRDLAKMRNDYESQQAQKDERLEGLRDQVEKNRRGHDPMWGRFQTRGWLERQVRDGEKVYLVRWGSDFIAQVQCSSRRYELDLYDGFEIGVQGVPVTSARAESGAYPVVDIDRIEVISARMRDR